MTVRAGTTSDRPARGLEASAQQQAALAHLGRQALAGLDLGARLSEASALVARTLNTDNGLVLETLGEADSLRLRAGTGLRDGMGGCGTVRGERLSNLRLTLRQRQVLHLLAQGQTNREIAANLSVGVGSVKTHIERIIAGLGVSDRTQAAVRGIELGLLTSRPGD